jgi:hypothetical protein
MIGGYESWDTIKLISIRAESFLGYPFSRGVKGAKISRKGIQIDFNSVTSTNIKHRWALPQSVQKLGLMIQISKNNKYTKTKWNSYAERHDTAVKWYCTAMFLELLSKELQDKLFLWPIP